MLASFGVGALFYSLTAGRWWPGSASRASRRSAAHRARRRLRHARRHAVALARRPPAIALIGLGFYMLHNTLQTNATQMAPEARGLAVSLFAFMLCSPASRWAWRWRRP